MKRKKQLLSWVLSFLMVFSIMPMISISALAATYDVNDGIGHMPDKVKPGDVIKNSYEHNAGMNIMYYKNEDDYNADIADVVFDKFVKNFPIELSEDTIVSSKKATLKAPNGYVLDSYTIKYIESTGGQKTKVFLTPNWTKGKRITYEMDNIIVGNENIVVDGESSVADGVTYVTTGAAVSIPITANTGYKLPDTIAVEMGGTEKPAYEYDPATGIIRIYHITGDVTIKAAGVLVPSQQTETPVKRTHGGGGSNNSTVKSEILIVELTQEAIINAIKTSDYKKIQVNVDNNPNLLLSKPIIDALAANKDKTLIIVSNNVSTDIRINEKNEMQFTRNGNLLIGFIPVFNAEYYLNYNGIAQKGWVQLPGETWYYFDKETGIKAKRWIKDSGTWYYSNSLGVMQTGWLDDNGTWYYLNSNGSMAHDTRINGYLLGSSGAYIKE